MSSAPMRSENTRSIAMFAGLPSAPDRRKAFAGGFLIQLVALAVMIQLGMIHPAAFVHRHEYVYISLAPPVPVNHEPQRIPPKLLADAKLRHVEPPKEHLAKLEPPKIEVPVPKPDIAEVKPVAPRTQPSFPPVIAERPSNKPPGQVKASGFSTGSSATPTVLADARKVQTGGFGDPNGVPAGNNTSGRVNIAALGSFDLPPGSGYGNGSGGSRGIRGIVASSGFGNGVATGSGGGGSSRSGSVKQSGFGDVEPIKPVARRQENTVADTQPVQILSKPTPSYTPDARAARVEGEVLLEVVFSASGQVKVLRVVSGLGHGLDESAIRAAEQIRYKPAIRSGTPVDFTATLHIVFQMA